MAENLTTGGRTPDQDRSLGINGPERTGTAQPHVSDESTSEVDSSKHTTPSTKKEPSKTQKATAATLAALAITAGTMQMAKSAGDGEIDPIRQSQETSSQTSEHLVIEGIEVGDGLRVLNQTLQFSTDKVNVRTSPMVESTPDGDTKLADTPYRSMPGSQNITVLHAIVAEDDINPSNGRWLGFTDKDGKVYWVNENALNESGYQVQPETSEVVVVETNTNGIIAKPQSDPENGAEITVGTVVSS